MNGGLASPAARRSEVSESASRSRREPARAPAPALMAGRTNGGRAAVPGTRERMQASFGAAELAPVLAIVPPAAEALTTRDRIVNRALATAEGAPPGVEPAAVVVDLAPARERRRERQPEVAAATPGRLVPVIALASRSAAARAPPVPVTGSPPGAGPASGDVRASAAAARAPPAPKPEETGIAPPEPGATPAPEVVPEGAGPETSPTTGAALSAEPPAGGGEPAALLEAVAPAPSAAPQAAAQPELVGVAAGAPAADPLVSRNPEDEPGFQAMKAQTHRAAVRTKDHQPGKEGAENAQGASRPKEQIDIDSQAAEEHVETLGDQKPGRFDPGKFKEDVKKQVLGLAPPATLEEADKFQRSGKSAEATSAIHEIVAAGKAASEKDIKEKREAPLKKEDKEPKPVDDMVNDRPGAPLPGVGAANALPKPVPSWWTDLSAGPLVVQAKMAEGNLTEKQLADANEPAFSAVLAARDEVSEHAAADPADYRTQEELVLARGRAEAEGAAGAELEGMHAARTGTLDAVLGVKGDTKVADAQRHDDVHQSILGIHEQTQTDVKTLLDALDSTVETIFTTGEKAARKNFEDYVAEEMRKYKDDRYSGVFGWARWLKDRFADLPKEVNRFYERGRADYLTAMDNVIEVIALVVGMLLGAAHLRIQMGREQVRGFVEGLPKSRRQHADEVAADLDNRFDQLTSDVDAKRDELVDTVARKYIESRDDLDSRIKELQEANKGLVSKAIDAVIGVIKMIYELTKLLLRVLLKAASAIGDIVAHPIRFLETLVGAVKGGLERFIERFPTHLQKSLVDLLFGELGKTGITMPKELNFAGIVDLVLQVLGLTYSNIRERVVKRFGEEAVAQMEEKVDVFRTLLKEGVGGLWTWIQQKLTDLEDLVIGKIKEYIEERVVRAGIGYIVALLNPAAAFIKACQGIYQIVMFIVERAKQIADFVDAVLDSIAAIAQGNIGAAVEKIDNALAGALTLAIGFLARLANLGALSEKMRSIIAVVRKPITRVVDQVVFGAAQIYKRTLGPAIAFGKAKLQSGKDFVKGKAQAVKDRLKHPSKAPDLGPQESADGAVAASTDPLPDAEMAGPLVIHEPFRMEGDDHELYTSADGRELILSSRRVTPITEVHDPTGELDRLHGRYLAARARYNNALAEHRTAVATNPNARTGWTVVRDEIDAIVNEIVAQIRMLGLEESPGASAPGIGDIRLHGQQQTRMENGPRVWFLESEHILPFAIGKMLWDTVGQLVPGRQKFEDREQTTIMLYERASNEKTGYDQGALRRFEAHYIDHLQDTIAEMRRRAGVLHDVEYFGEASEAEFRDGFAGVLAGMSVESDKAVEETETAVLHDHRTVDEGHTLTRGARRAEPKSVPADHKIRKAARKQYDAVVDLARQTVEGRRR